jgi:uncharacterized protein with beta-barrel porin domain
VLAGCTPSEDSVETFFGIAHNTVVLTASAVELAQAPLNFTPSAEAKVVGKEAKVCIVLAGGVSMENSEHEVRHLLKGAEINATVTVGDGTMHTLSCQSTEWAQSGRIFPSDEISACVSESCAQEALPVGSQIRSFSISATAPIHALGVYWHSDAG